MLNKTIAKLQGYIQKYVFIADDLARIVALWIIATYVFESFDAFPYLVITARVKRAGKTRLSELIGFTCHAPMPVAGATAAALFRSVRDRRPTIIWDEAETLSSESATTMRAFLNTGYRKGQTIPRAIGQEQVEDWPTYCPKVFVLIGDVNDTLRDRSIIVQMTRGEVRNRFSYEVAREEGLEIADEIRHAIAQQLAKGKSIQDHVSKFRETIRSEYESTEIQFLTDRDEEIWRPIFAIAKYFSSAEGLERIAVDLATEKTSDETYKPDPKAEKEAADSEYAEKLVRDLLSVIPKNAKGINSSVAVAALKEIELAPWRKFRGKGIDPISMAQLLERFSLYPKPFRSGAEVSRGYLRSEVVSAVKNL